MEDESNEALEKNQPLKNELEQMGFPIDRVIQALGIYKTKEEAIEYLINSKEEEKPVQQMAEQIQDDYQDEEEDYKMIFVVRMDLKLALGKIAELVATAALKAYKQIEALIEIDENKQFAFFQWTEGGQRKIVVKAPSEKELLEVAEKAKAANINYVLINELPSNLKYEKVQPQPSASKKKKKEKEAKNIQKGEKIETKKDEGQVNKKIKENEKMETQVIEQIGQKQKEEKVQKKQVKVKDENQEKGKEKEKASEKEEQKETEEKTERDLESEKKMQPEKQILVLGAFGPAAQSDIDPFTKHFKLL